MEVLREQSVQVAAIGNITNPDQPAQRVWMVHPSGILKPVPVNGTGVLRTKVIKKKNVPPKTVAFLTDTAIESGWRTVEEVYGAEAVREAEAWDAACKEAKGKRAIPPPKFIADAYARTLTPDDEPPEGANQALKAEERRKRAEMATAARDRAEQAKASAGEEPTAKAGKAAKS